MGASLEKSRILSLVTFCKDFWDRYPVKVPEVFAKGNSTQFPFRF